MKWLSDHRMAVLGFMVSAAYLPGQLQGAFIPRWAVMAVGLPLVSKIDPRAVPEPMRWVIGFLLFACGLSLMRSPFVEAGVGDLIFIIILCAAFVAGAALASLDDLMIGIGAGLAISFALSIGQYSGLWSPVPESSSPSGLFYNSEVLGEFSALVAVWAAVRFLSAGGWFMAALSVVSIIPVVLTHSRIGAAALAIGLVYAWRPRWRVLLPMMLAIAAAVLYAVLFTKFSSSVHRVVLWGTTVMWFTSLGNGLGWGTAAFPFEEFAHSDALQAVAELGIAGIALIFIPIAAFYGNRGNNAERALFAAVCVETLVSFPLHFPAGGFLAAVVAGYLVGTGPALRIIAPESRDADELRGFWWGHVAPGNAFSGREVGDCVPVRSVFPRLAALRARAIGQGRP